MTPAGLVLCGGRGTRLEAAVEKPVFEVGGRPMVDRVLAALEDSGVGEIRAVTSPQAPATSAHLRERGVERIAAPGDGYVADLTYALDRVSTPALTVAADLPLLDAAAVDRVLDARRGSLAVYVPAALKSALGVSYDRSTERDGRSFVPAGVNVVADDADETRISYDARYAVNVNRRADAAVAERLLGRTEGEDGS